MSSDGKGKDAEKSYEAKRKKYGLPALSDIQNEIKLPLSAIDADSSMVLMSIRNESVKRINEISRDLEAVIAGYDRFSSSIERKTFSRNDRIRLFETYRLLQQLLWDSRIACEKEEAYMAKWINAFMKAWKDKIKDELIWYYSKMKESWAEIEGSDTEIKYVG